MINRACDLMVNKGFNVFIAYGDPDANEVGTVYQASGWNYVGKGGSPTIINRGDRMVDSRIIGIMTRGRKGLPDRKRGATVEDVSAWANEMRAEGYVVKGEGFYQHYELMTRQEAQQKLIAGGATFYKGSAKYRYIHFAGDKRTVRLLKKALRLPKLPYPKRPSHPSQPSQVAKKPAKAKKVDGRGRAA
jgi:hypothetical protein